jgi:hypothetical protein
MGDIAELGAKISALIESKLDATEREALRRDCARRYDWTEIAQKTSLTYDELVDPKWRANSIARQDQQASAIWDEFGRSLGPARQRRQPLP